MGYLSQYRNLIVGHTDCNYRCLLKVWLYLLTDKVFGLILGKSAYLDFSYYREVYLSGIVYQILLERRLGCSIYICQRSI